MLRSWEQKIAVIERSSEQNHNGYGDPWGLTHLPWPVAH